MNVTDSYSLKRRYYGFSLFNLLIAIGLIYFSSRSNEIQLKASSFRFAHLILVFIAPLTLLVFGYLLRKFHKNTFSKILIIYHLILTTILSFLLLLILNFYNSIIPRRYYSFSGSTDIFQYIPSLNSLLILLLILFLVIQIISAMLYIYMIKKSYQTTSQTCRYL